MRGRQKFILALALAALAPGAHAQTLQRVANIPTRPGVNQRIIVLTPVAPKAVVVLLAGGHGGLQIAADGAITWGEGNFLLRSRHAFVDQGLEVAVVDAPSDRGAPHYLNSLRQTPEHVADLKAVIAWLRRDTALPVWLVGTSRGTESAAYAATELAGIEGPDGIVLTSTIVSDRSGRPVSAMALQNIRVPVLLVHHRQDGCRFCSFALVPPLIGKLSNAPRKELLAVEGGSNRGDPCQSFAYHGFNGLEPEVVRSIAAFVLAR